MKEKRGIVEELRVTMDSRQARSLRVHKRHAALRCAGRQVTTKYRLNWRLKWVKSTDKADDEQSNATGRRRRPRWGDDPRGSRIGDPSCVQRRGISRGDA